MAQSRIRTLTDKDLLAMRSGIGERYELIEGELIVTAAAGGKHGQIAQTIAGEIYLFLKDHPLGILVTAETGFYTRGNDHTVRAPDLAFIRTEMIPQEGLPDGYLRITPDLVLEVVSPNDRAAEVDEQVQEWLTFGVREVWVAYPATRRVMVYNQGSGRAVILNAGDKINGREVLPGFEQSIATFFG